MRINLIKNNYTNFDYKINKNIESNLGFKSINEHKTAIQITHSENQPSKYVKLVERKLISL